MSHEHLILLGTNIDKLYGVVFDDEAKTLKKTAENKTELKSSWITQHPAIPDIVYFNSAASSKIFAATYDSSGTLTVLDEAQQSEEAKGPCHFTLSHDNSALIIANYASGNVTLLPLDDQGRFLSKKTEPSHNFEPPYEAMSHPRQDQPHAHQAVMNGNEVLVPDLGSNKVWRIRPGTGGDNSRWVVEGFIGGYNDGDGPRQCVVHPDGKILYVLDEISSDLTVHTLPANPKDEAKLLQRFTLLPPKDQKNGPSMKAAALIYLPPISAGGKGLLLGTNRDSKQPEGDAIAVFTVAPDGSVDRAPTPWLLGVGNGLRGMTADKSGKWVCVAGETGGGTVVFERVGEVEMKEVARIQGLESVIAPLWV